MSCENCKELEAELALKEKQADAYEEKIETKIVELQAENVRLRSCLKRLEWCVDGNRCPACGNLIYSCHGPDCCLAAEIAREGLTASGPSESKPKQPPSTR